MNAIDRLNQTIEERLNMINEIIMIKHAPRTDRIWDKLEKTYEKKGYSELKTLLKNLKQKEELK